jgi:2-oxoglutarate ferredoxin oxidoreductase subunit gamma
MTFVARDPVQVRLTGTGGQGVITAGIILAEAALMDGRNVVQTQSYGPEARLGASKSEVIISTRKIAYPQVTVPDVLLCLSEDAFNKYFRERHDDTIVLLDSAVTDEPVEDGRRIFKLPIVATALQVGPRVVVNVVALAALNALTGLVSQAALKAAVLRRVPVRLREPNEAAFAAGERLAVTAQEAIPRGRSHRPAVNSNPAQGG